VKTTFSVAKTRLFAPSTRAEMFFSAAQKGAGRGDWLKCLADMTERILDFDLWERKTAEDESTATLEEGRNRRSGCLGEESRRARRGGGAFRQVPASGMRGGGPPPHPSANGMSPFCWEPGSTQTRYVFLTAIAFHR